MFIYFIYLKQQSFILDELKELINRFSEDENDDKQIEESE